MQWLYWILSFLLAGAAAYLVFRADKRRAVPYPWLTALLRGLLILLTLFLLLAPAVHINRNETQKPVVVFLQDNSASIAHALGQDSTSYRTNASELIENLGEDYRVVTWAFGNRVQQDSTYNYHQEATDISSALARAQEYYGLQNLGAVILATDGQYNQGSNPMFQQLSLRSPLYTVGIGDSSRQKDLRLSQVYSNKVVTLNSQFEVRADVIASLANGYENAVQLTENGKLISTAPLAIRSDRYDRSVSFTVSADKPGLHHYVISIPVAEGEANTANNRRDLFVEVVDEKKKVLIVSAAPHPDVNAIKEALSTQETYEITTRTADKLPADFSGYDAIVLHQLPSVRMDLPPALRNANKPTWYILGEQSSPSLANQHQQSVFVNTSPGAVRDVMPAYNPGFNLFTLPPDIRAVADRLPPLNMQPGNIKVSPNAVALFQQRDSKEQMPLWILQQGTRPMAMLTGEGLWRWRLYEYRYFNQHQVVDECIRQTILFLTAGSNDRPFQVTLPKYVWNDKESIAFNAYLLNANNQQINTPEAALTVTDSAGNKQQYSFERAGNTYRLNIGIHEGGAYRYTATTSYNGKTYAANGSFVVESMPLEMMETGADYPLLYGLAHKYNGGFVPAANISQLYDSIKTNAAIKPVLISRTETVPLVDWKWYFFLIVLLAVAEWLLRKYWMAQ